LSLRQIKVKRWAAVSNGSDKGNSVKTGVQGLTRKELNGLWVFDTGEGDVTIKDEIRLWGFALSHAVSCDAFNFNVQFHDGCYPLHYRVSNFFALTRQHDNTKKLLCKVDSIE
jgi:hypothetical protein